MNFPTFDNDLYDRMRQPNPVESEKIKQLKEINNNLRNEIDFAVRQAEEAKKESHLSRVFSFISLLIAALSAVAAVLPYIA